MEDVAREQAWDGKRPWRVGTHVVWERDLLCLDLHDLKARNARLALGALLEVVDALEGCEVLIVTGKGAHSVGPPVLHRLAGDRLAQAVAERDDWSLQPRGSGAWLLSTDPDRATGQGVGSFLLLFFTLLALALAWLVARGAVS